jgi:hypothetical protein
MRQWKLTEAAEFERVASQRAARFGEALTNPLDPQHARAREGLERERRELRAVQKIRDACLPERPSWRTDWWQPVLLSIGLAMPAVMLWRVKEDCWFRTLPEADRQAAFRPGLAFTLFAVGYSVTDLITQSFTSVMAADKAWYAWDSFCASPGAWTAMRLVLASSGLSVACGISLMYEATRKRLIPTLHLDHPGGQCGVGDYLRFLENWTAVGLGATAAGLLLFLKVATDQMPRFDPLYLLVPSFGLAWIVLLLMRMRRNALKIREDYLAMRAGLGRTWGEVVAANAPADPTQDFVGRHWWQLPALATTFILAAWALLSSLGLADRVIESLGR